MGKNFDLFIKHRDFVPEHLRRYIDRAKLFLFDVYPTQSMDSIPVDELRDITFNFCLPFPVVAIEDKTSCVILWEEEKGRVGIEHPRGMMEIADTVNYLNKESYKLTSQDLAMGLTKEKDDEARDALKHFAEIMGDYPIMFRHGFGSLSWLNDIRKWQGSAVPKICEYRNRSGSERFDFLGDDFQDDGGNPSATETDLIRGFITAHEELLSMSVRNTFVVEKTPKKKNKKTRSLKSNSRPTYTVVSPKKAREIMGILEPKRNIDKKKRIIKERRACVRREHSRTLTSEKFVHKKGQEVTVRRTYIPAIWRGESVGETDTHFYKVILDLPKGIRDSCEEK